MFLKPMATVFSKTFTFPVHNIVLVHKKQWTFRQIFAGWDRHRKENKQGNKQITFSLSRMWPVVPEMSLAGSNSQEARM